MNVWRVVGLIFFGVGLLLAGEVGVQKFVTSKPDMISKFSVQPSQMEKDLAGHVVPVAYGQYWPFDTTQALRVSVLSKKQSDEYVVVVAEVSALADAQPEKDKKDEKPKRVALNGVARLTYEMVGKDWYLIRTESITLQVTAAQ